MRNNKSRPLQTIAALVLAVTLALSPGTIAGTYKSDIAYALTEASSHDSSDAVSPVDNENNLYPMNNSASESSSESYSEGTVSSDGEDDSEGSSADNPGSSDSSDSSDSQGSDVDNPDGGNDTEIAEPEPEPEPLKPHKVKANGTADAAIEFARQYSGLKGLKNVKERMKFHRYSMWYPGFNSQWCAWFVTNCGYMTGSSGRFGASVAVNSLAYSTVNSKGARITFVNYGFYNSKKYSFVSSRRSYNKEYKPRKGDIIIFSKDGKYWWSHVGLVTAAHDNPKKDVPTIEGNTGSMNYKKAVVEEKLRTSRKGARIVAYITPKYRKSKSK